VSASNNGTSWAVKNFKDLRIRVVGKLDVVLCRLSSVQSNFDVVTHVEGRHQRLGAGQGWRTTHQGLLVNDGYVHCFLSVKNALCLVETHVDEILSFDSDLRVAVSWTTGWLK